MEPFILLHIYYCDRTLFHPIIIIIIIYTFRVLCNIWIGDKEVLEIPEALSDLFSLDSSLSLSLFFPLSSGVFVSIHEKLGDCLPYLHFLSSRNETYDNSL